MVSNKVQERIKADEYHGEKLISKIRFTLALIYGLSVPLVSVLRNLEGFGYLPWRSNIGPAVFFLYAVFLFYYIQKKQTFHRMFKYICAALDAVTISIAIWVGCTYLKEAPPLPFLSIQALFYSILILAGSFRYSVRCAYFSGVFAGVCYFTVVIINREVLDLPYFFEVGGGRINVSFPVFNEFFRVIGMLVTGWVAGLATKRRLALFNSIAEAEAAAAKAASQTVEQTRSMAGTIRKSTDEIFLSSKDIFTTANNQSASLQEIEATIKENTQIAAKIAEKTGSVADIASKMESDVISGFSVLERNVDQMEDIKNKNDGVISGITELGNKISKICEIIGSINNITDQTKVIAFNAALEAASAGEQGNRFSVVAGEVNRLADSIAVLTKQIRAQLEEIQKSSSHLITSSEDSANKIAEGNFLIKELEAIFYEIRSGAEITSNQAQTITVSTQKQRQSIEQINIAIANISKGLSNFISSTRIATSSAAGLTETIEELGELLKIKTNTEELNDQY